MLGDRVEPGLRERLRRETLSMSTFTLASRLRWARRQVERHPGQPHYEIEAEVYDAELRRRGVLVIR